MSIEYNRTRGELTPADFGNQLVTITVSRKDDASTITESSESNTPPNVSVGSRMQDVVTRNWFKRQRAGEFINNPMLKEERWASVVEMYTGIYSDGYSTRPETLPTSAIIGYKAEVEQYLPPFTAFPEVPSLDLDYIKFEAINSAFAKSHQRDVLGIVDLAEMGKTFAMLRMQLGRFESLITQGLYHNVSKTAVRVRNTGNRIMQYKGKSPLGIAADTAGLWLETQYGIIPLMLSIQGLIKALTAPVDSSSGMVQPRTFRGSESIIRADELINTDTYPLVGYDDNPEVVSEYKLQYSQVAYARAGVSTKYKPSLRGRLGLELRDIVPAAYELITLSFVLDWFYNINSYLEAVTPVKGLVTEASWVTLHNEVVLQYMFERTGLTAHSSSESWEIVIPPIQTQFVIGYRTSERIPGVVPHNPQFNAELQSLTHFISGTALILSRILGGKAFRKLLTV